MALHTGEDFELLFTVSPKNLAKAQSLVSFTVMGEVVRDGVWLDDSGEVKELEDRGYEH